MYKEKKIPYLLIVNICGTVQFHSPWKIVLGRDALPTAIRWRYIMLKQCPYLRRIAGRCYGSKHSLLAYTEGYQFNLTKNLRFKNLNNNKHSCQVWVSWPPQC